MDDWTPREHDHLVEPVFHGLGLEPRPAPSSRALAIAIVCSALALVVRVATLL